LLEKKVLKSAFKWQVFNISLQAILQFVFIFISARVLPKEVHGAFAILNALIFVMTISSEGGVSSALIQRKNVNDKHISIAFYITMLISTILFIAIFFSSGIISEFYDQKIGINEIRWASIVFVLMALGKVSESYLIKYFKYKELFISKNVSFLIGNIVCVYFFAKLGYGIFALIYGFIVTQSINTALYYLFYRHSLKFNWGKKEFNELFYFGSSFTLLRVVNYLSSQIDKLLIGKFYSVTALSVYEKGQYISRMPAKYVGNTIDSLMFSAFSKIEDNVKKGKYFLMITAGIFFSGLYFACLFYFNSDIIVTIILGSNWLDTVPYLQLLSIAIPAILLARLGDVIVRSENKMFKSLPVKLGFLLLLLGSIYIFSDSELLFVTAMVVVCYWLHGAAMFTLSVLLLKSNPLKFLKLYVLIIVLIVMLILKYFGIDNVGLSDLNKIIINIFTDVLLLLIAGWLFRKKPFVVKIKSAFLGLLKKKL